MALEADLLEIEATLWRGGPDAYRAHCDDSCIVVFPQMAGTMLREEIAAGAQAGRWRDVRITPRAFNVLSGDCAVVAYACSARRADGSTHLAFVTSTYVRRHDGWKLAVHQQTPATAAPAK